MEDDIDRIFRHLTSQHANGRAQATFPNLQFVLTGRVRSGTRNVNEWVMSQNRDWAEWVIRKEDRIHF